MLFAEHIGVYIREKLICWPEEEELLHINRYRIKKKRKYYHKNETLLLSKRKSYENAARPNRKDFYIRIKQPLVSMTSSFTSSKILSFYLHFFFFFEYPKRISSQFRQFYFSNIKILQQIISLWNKFAGENNFPHNFYYFYAKTVTILVEINKNIVKYNI